jgi:guanylate kinase
MNRETKRIIVVGCAASGKDYLVDNFVKIGFIKDVSKTTRPPREGEVNGYSYDFISEVEFRQGIDMGMFKEYVEFNGWLYGTARLSWDTSDIFIMTPSGISQLSEYDRENSIIIYLDIAENIRRERIEKRSDADSAERRLEADRKDFENFSDFDVKVTSPKFNTRDVIKLCTFLLMTNDITSC